MSPSRLQFPLPRSYRGGKSRASFPGVAGPPHTATPDTARSEGTLSAGWVQPRRPRVTSELARSQQRSGTRRAEGLGSPGSPQ